MRVVPLLAAVLGTTACGEPKKAAPADDTPSARVELVGIEPDRWTCDRVASRDAVAAAVGGHVRDIEGTMAPPRGTPKPCNYLLDAAPPVGWTFDLDCRPGALRTADVLWK